VTGPLHEDTLTAQEFRDVYARPGRPVVINMSRPSQASWEWADFAMFHEHTQGSGLGEVNSRGSGCPEAPSYSMFAKPHPPGRRAGDKDGCEWYYLLRTDSGLDPTVRSAVERKVGRPPAFTAGLELLGTYWFYIGHIATDRLMRGLGYHIGCVQLCARVCVCVCVCVCGSGV